MAIYKGVEVDDVLVGIIRFMQGVEDYREGLSKLQGAWDILSLLGQLTGAAAEMSGTRESFQRLTGNLLNHLGQETRSKAVADLRDKTQNGIDILVRNLFERTADIGFLSADDDVREFLLRPDSGGQRGVLEERFHEYVEKYSVYSDIVLFDQAGRIKARLVAHALETSTHPLREQSRSTCANYVEYFGAADFLPPGEHLVYAYRVVDSQAAFLGVLALVFRLDDEMDGVFAKLLEENDCSLLATVTADGRVVATSSPIQLPVGSRLGAHLLAAQGEVVRFAGREYLAVACPAHGYQGYAGPGWLGLGLIPVEFAFERNDKALLAHLDHRVLAAVTSHTTLFSEELRRIPQQAECIQAELNRSVWNGSVRQVDSGQNSSQTSGQTNPAFAKTLLWEISNTGRKTQAIFEQSIGNLHQTVVAALLQSGVSRAAFAIDVMDRNLYERANDCRWWALNATFRRVLASGDVDTEEAKGCGTILAYINALYTVYDNLILFDAQGRVIAVSRPEGSVVVGSRLHEEWVERCLALSDSQGYVVSHFATTPLYGNRPTYIYAAAVSQPGGSRSVGGIALVFDGSPQFAAMLGDALPRDCAGEPVEGAFSLFVQRDGRVLSTTDARFPVASPFPLERAQRELKQGELCSSIILLNGHYYALGAAQSAGYREYKTSNGSRDDVLSLAAFPLGAAATVGTGAIAPRKSGLAQSEARGRRLGSGSDVLEIATFYVGEQWLGVSAADVVEAIDADGITAVMGARSELVAGIKMYRGQLISVLHLQNLIEPQLAVVRQPSQIVVVKTRNKVCLGLLVDELGEIPEVASDQILPVGNVAGRPGALTVGVVSGLGKEGDRHGMLSVIGVDRLCQRAGCHCSNENLGFMPVVLEAGRLP
jgi:chemotaxis signal transduction protein